MKIKSKIKVKIIVSEKEAKRIIGAIQEIIPKYKLEAGHQEDIEAIRTLEKLRNRLMIDR